MHKAGGGMGDFSHAYLTPKHDFEGEYCESHCKSSPETRELAGLDMLQSIHSLLQMFWMLIPLLSIWRELLTICPLCTLRLWLSLHLSSLTADDSLSPSTLSLVSCNVGRFGCTSRLLITIGHVNKIPTMRWNFFSGISRNTQAKSYMLSLTECVWDFQNNALWDTH